MNRPKPAKVRAIAGGLVIGAFLIVGVGAAGAASTSFAVTNVVTAVNPGTCPANFLGSLAVGSSSSGTSTLDITGSTATQTLSNGLVLTGPVTGNVVTVAVERPVTSGSVTFTERRESTFTLDGTAATGSSALTVTLPSGGTCNATFALTGTLDTALIPDQVPTTTVVTSSLAPTTTAPPTTAPATTAAAATTAPADLPNTGLESSTILVVGAAIAALGAAVLALGLRRARSV